MTTELRDVLEKVVDQAENHPDEPLTVVEDTPIVEEPKEGTPPPKEGLSEPPQGTPPATPPATKKDGSEPPSEGQKTPPEGNKGTPPAEGKKEHVTERAPASWTKEGKEKWATLPVEARQEIIKRETEINNALKESAQSRQLANDFHQAMGAHYGRLREGGVHPMQAVKNMMDTDHFLRSAPPAQRAAAMAKMISDYQIDLTELDTALSGQLQGKRNPAFDVQEAVRQAVAPLMAPIQNWQQQQAQQALQEQEESLREVQRMELDPKYEFFTDVRELMADLIDMHAKRNLVLGLEDAYNMAIKTHPEISQIVAEREKQEAAKQALERSSQAAQRGRAASLSVSGSGNTTSTNGSSVAAGMGLRETIEAAFTAAGSGGRV